MRLGVDLGGTKTEIIALGDGESELLRRRIASPQGDYRATLDAIAGLVTAAESQLGRQGTLGVAIPGTLAGDLIKNANSTWLNGKPLARDLGTALGRDVRLANDANCFALSEATDGAAEGCAVVFGVMATLLALLPFAGAAVVWVPAVGWLLFNNQVGAAVFLLAWGGALSTADNFVRPALISHHTPVSTLLVFLGVLGGMTAFGLVGFIIGPVLLVLATELLRFAEVTSSPQP